jgi:DNA-directed RNA polymerase subunit RPC12/RpoP
MVETIVRCPYCVAFDLSAFMPMVDGGSGVYICTKCGHLAIPGDKSAHCRCRRCVAKEAFTPDRGRVWWTQSA